MVAIEIDWDDKPDDRPPLRAVPNQPPPMFDDKGRFVVPACGEYLQDEGHLCMGHDGRIYRYHEKGVYRPDGESWARQQIRDLLGDAWKRNHADEVIAWLRASPVVIGPTPSLEYLNCANGLLRLRDRRLRPHSPQVGSSIQVGPEWHPEAACPRIDKFLTEVLPSIPPAFTYELFGYTLYPSNPFAKAVMCLGAGSNGKSIYLSLLRALLGSGNYSSVALQALSENRFSAADIFGKLANVCGDIDARAIKRTDLFKQITGGDPIMAERKYGQPFEFIAFATPWFSANDPPMTSDQTDAWFRRWVILPFAVKFEQERADPFLLAKLTTPDELSGLLVESVNGLHRLMERGFFEQPGAVEVAGTRYRDRLDTVRGYVDEECVLVPAAWTQRSGFYRGYAEWCREGGRMPLSAASFNDRLQRDYPDVELVTVKGERRWKGISRRGVHDMGTN